MADVEGPGGTRPFFPNLDGLRFIAFLLVFLQHSHWVREAAGIGVAFFFVLSGFLITYLLMAEADEQGRVDVRAFYIRRALRIWPLYFLVLSFAFVLYPAAKALAGVDGRIANGSPFFYLFFLGNFDVLRVSGREGDGAGFLNILWSVSIEEQFYLFWPLLLQRPRPRRALTLLLSVIVASFVFRLLHSDDQAILYFHTLSVISDMAIGGLAALAWRTSPGFRAFIWELPARAIALGYVLGLAFVFTQPLWGPVTRLVTGLFFAGLVLEQNFCRSSLFKASDSLMLSSLGRYTYGLYMLHMIVLFALEKGLDLVGRPVIGAWYPTLLLTVGLPASILAARASYTLIESPFLKLKPRFSPGAKAGRAPAAG